MVDRSVPIGPVWGVAAGSQADDGPGSVLVEDGSLAHAPKADPSRGHEGGVYQRPDERVKRAAGRGSPSGEPRSGLLGGLGERLCLLEEGVRLVVVGADRCEVAGQRIGPVLVVAGPGDGRGKRKPRRVVVVRPTVPVLEERVELAA